MAAEQLLTIVSIAVIIIVWLGRLTWVLSALSTKVDVMWTLQIKQAFTNAVDKGVATLNSPLEFVEEEWNKLDSIKPDLQEWWRVCNGHLDNKTALIHIEKAFGDRLLKEISLPYKMPYWICLLLALAVAQNTRTIELNFNGQSTSK